VLTLRIAPAAVLLGMFSGLHAQTQSQALLTTVPRLVRITNSFHPANGQPAATVEGVTLSIYREEHDGAVLWQETQNVRIDAEGRYTAVLGSTLNDGMPLELFTSGEPRWLGVRFNRAGEVEQPRVQLTSVPYALKAVDADTLGGRPASAYLLSPNVVTDANHGTAERSTKSASTAKSIGVSVSTADAQDFFGQTGFIVGDTTGAQTGIAVQNTTGGASSYSGMLFYDQNGALGQFQGFNNSTHEYRINNISSNGTINFMLGSSSKFFVRNGGNVGIGTTTPNATLDVNGTIGISGTQIIALSSGGSGIAVGSASSPPANNNTSVGIGALLPLVTGTFNSAFGSAAALNVGTGNQNTALGGNALVTITNGSSNIGVGYNAGSNLPTGANNNIDIGHIGGASDSATIRIGTPGTQGAFFAAGIRGVTTGLSNAVPVLVDSNGQLGTASSSRRFKEDIQDMGETSGGLMRLRPVTFRYKKAFDDGSKPIQYGLIAEEVSEVYPDLVARSADGQIETVKYQVLPSMLLNEVQRQELKIRGMQQQIDEQRKQNDEQRLQNMLLQERLAKLEATLASVSSGVREP
jgi:hypothetical protein